MGKRNKGGSKQQRRSYSMKKRGEFEADHAKAWEVFSLFDKWELDDVHRILFTCLRTVEVAIEGEGRKPNQYVEHRVTHVEHDLGPDFTYCRRCRYAVIDGEDEMGKWSRCTHPNMDGLLCAHHDGCTFGVRKVE